MHQLITGHRTSSTSKSWALLLLPLSLCLGEAEAEASPMPMQALLRGASDSCQPPPPPKVSSATGIVDLDARLTTMERNLDRLFECSTRAQQAASASVHYIDYRKTLEQWWLDKSKDGSLSLVEDDARATYYLRTERELIALGMSSSMTLGNAPAVFMRTEALLSEADTQSGLSLTVPALALALESEGRYYKMLHSASTASSAQQTRDWIEARVYTIASLLAGLSRTTALFDPGYVSRQGMSMTAAVSTWLTMADQTIDTVVWPVPMYISTAASKVVSTVSTPQLELPISEVVRVIDGYQGGLSNLFAFRQAIADWHRPMEANQWKQGGNADKATAYNPAIILPARQKLVSASAKLSDPRFRWSEVDLWAREIDPQGFMRSLVLNPDRLQLLEANVAALEGEVTALEAMTAKREKAMETNGDLAKIERGGTLGPNGLKRQAALDTSRESLEAKRADKAEAEAELQTYLTGAERVVEGNIEIDLAVSDFGVCVFLAGSLRNFDIQRCKDFDSSLEWRYGQLAPDFPTRLPRQHAATLSQLIEARLAYSGLNTRGLGHMRMLLHAELLRRAQLSPAALAQLARLFAIELNRHLNANAANGAQLQQVYTVLLNSVEQNMTRACEEANTAVPGSCTAPLVVDLVAGHASKGPESGDLELRGAEQLETSYEQLCTASKQSLSLLDALEQVSAHRKLAGDPAPSVADFMRLFDQVRNAVEACENWQPMVSNASRYAVGTRD